MSTPSLQQRATPRVGGALTPSVSTPARSVPSPANISSKNIGKSQWKSGQSASQTPVAGSLNANTPTPSAALPAGSSPAMLDGSHRNKLAAALGPKSAAGSPMPNTPAAFSGLGLTLTPLASQLQDGAILDNLGIDGRDAEAWATQKTKDIVDMLSHSWGVVNQDNIKRCVDRIGGLECYWEDHPGGKEKLGERKRTLVIAGNEMMLEIGWVGERVERVTLNFIRGDDAVADEIGAKILRQDLIGKAIGYVSVSDFVNNLSRLVKIDQLGRGKVSCFEALTGIAVSLKKLWELEVNKEEQTSKDNASARIKIMCEKSGRPRTHSQRSIGFRLDYWLDQRALVKSAIVPEQENHEYSLFIDCEAYNATQYPSIRISQAWLSAAVADAVSDPTLPIWDDPPLTFIPGTQGQTEPDALALGLASTTGTQPDVRFVARLQPPIVLPYFVATEIALQLQTLIPETYESTYLGLLFPKAAGLQDGTKEGKVLFDRKVTSYNKAQTRLDTKQRFEQFVQPGFWAHSINELPFSHPKQIIEILPYLRQWAFFGRLLQRSFGDKSMMDNGPATLPNKSMHNESTGKTSRTKRPINGYRHKYQHYEPPSDTDSSSDERGVERAARSRGIPTNTSQRGAKKVLTTSKTNEVDIVLETSFEYINMSQRVDMDISLKFISGKNDTACSFHLQVGPNAVVEIDSIAFRGARFTATFDSDIKIQQFRKKLQRVMRITEDLGAMASWVQSYISE